MHSEWCKALAGENGQRFLPVVDMIDAALEDPEHADQISVLDLICGTGKSSAVSLRIAEIIHAVKEEGSEDGILIVSDTKKALKRYLEPAHMPAVKAYLDENQDLISRLDEDTYPQEKNRFGRCPVLLITYARYFGSTKEYIQEKLLQWGNGKPRKYIIMDEQPPLRKVIGVGNSQVSAVNAALRNGLTTWNHEERAWFLAEWETVMSRFNEELESARRELFDIMVGDSPENMSGHAQTLHRPTAAALDQEDLARFRTMVENDQEAIGHQDEDAVVLLDSILEILDNDSYCSAYLKRDHTMEMSFHVARSNRKLVTGMGAKIIVLDGTADIDPMYETDYVHRVSCDALNTRRFPNLTVRIVNINTSRSAFKRDPGKIIRGVREYFRTQAENTRSVCIFCPKGHPEKMFIDEAIYGSTEHIGNTRGRNDLSDYRYIAQVGTKAKPPMLYLMEFLIMNAEMNGEGKPSFRSAIPEFPQENIPGFLEHLMNHRLCLDGRYDMHDLDCRDKATDFEQNVFRSAIRQEDFTEPAVYWLFTDTRMQSKLVDVIKQRFGPHGKYGARVDTPDLVQEMVRHIREHPTYKGEETSAHKILRWLTEREAGEEFSARAMYSGAGITPNQFGSAKTDWSTLAGLFDEMNQAHVPIKRGYYTVTEEVMRYLR